MIYRNTKTGITFETECVIVADFLEDITPKPKTTRKKTTTTDAVDPTVTEGAEATPNA